MGGFGNCRLISWLFGATAGRGVAFVFLFLFNHRMTNGTKSGKTGHSIAWIVEFTKMPPHVSLAFDIVNKVKRFNVSKCPWVQGWCVFLVRLL